MWLQSTELILICFQTITTAPITLSWNKIKFPLKKNLIHLLTTLEELLTGPGRGAAPPVTEEHSTPRFTLCSQGDTQTCSDQTPTTWEEVTAITEGTAPNKCPQPMICQQQGSQLKWKGLPQLTSVLHIKPMTRDIICQGIWGNMAPYTRGRLGLPPSTGCNHPGFIAQSQVRDWIQTHARSHLNGSGFQRIVTKRSMSNTCISNPYCILHKCLI